MSPVVLVVGKEHESVFPGGFACSLGVLNGFVYDVSGLGDVDYGNSAKRYGEFVDRRIGS